MSTRSLMPKRFILMSQPLAPMSAMALVVGFLVVGHSAVLPAQVFNPPAAQSVGGRAIAGGAQTGLPQAGVQQAGGSVTSTQGGTVEQAGWSGIPLPKVSLPKLTMPKLTMPSMTSVTAPMKVGFSKVSTGTKKAWEGTKEIFSLGESKPAAAPRVRSSTQKKTSIWHRLIARPAEPQGPQTVGEFMRQPRLDP